MELKVLGNNDLLCLTRPEVVGVDALDHVGTREAEQIVVALEVVRMAGKARPAEVGLGKIAGLDHRPHRAVEHDDARGEHPPESIRAGGGVGGGRVRRSGHGREVGAGQGGGKLSYRRIAMR